MILTLEVASPEAAQLGSRKFGEILRVVVAGVMDVLQSRQQIKDEFRMRMTHFRVADNNPLKFSANVDHALRNLLVKQNETYLGPVEAFEDAFRDLRNHQIAMLAGRPMAEYVTRSGQRVHSDPFHFDIPFTAGPDGMFPMSGSIPIALGAPGVVRIPVPGTRNLCIEFFPRNYKGQSTSL